MMEADYELRFEWRFRVPKYFGFFRSPRRAQKKLAKVNYLINFCHLDIPLILLYRNPLLYENIFFFCLILFPLLIKLLKHGKVSITQILVLIIVNEERGMMTSHDTFSMINLRKRSHVYIFF